MAGEGDLVRGTAGRTRIAQPSGGVKNGLREAVGTGRPADGNDGRRPRAWV